MSRRRIAGGLVPLLLLLTACAGAKTGMTARPAARGAAVVILARHLDTPRGVALSPSTGAVYVAEAGHGPRRCTDFCTGFTGAIGRYRSGKYLRVARGLLSVAAEPSTHNVRGLDGVSVAPNGALYGIETGLANVPPGQVSGAVAAQAERVVRVTKGKKVFGPRLGAYERAHNPDGHDVETDPYGIVATKSGRYVADAGGNDLLRAAGRAVSLVAVFPRAPHYESVPTAVALGPGGALYVGEFTGSGKGAARIWRVVPGHRAKIVGRGYTQISGLAFGADGSMYVTEGSTDGAFGRSHGDVVRVTKKGTRTRYGGSRLVAPAGAAVDAKGRIYVSNHSTRSSAYGPGGELVRLDP